MTGYNYDKFSTDDYEFEQVAGPVPGQKAPDFELTTPSGEKRRLLDFSGDFLNDAWQIINDDRFPCP